MQVRLIMSFNKLLPAVIFLAACTSQPKKEEAALDTTVVTVDSTSAQSETIENPFKLETYLFKGKVNGNDVQTISENSILIVNPTDAQIEEMKKEYGEDDFYTIADDASFYQSNAIMLIDSMGVKKTTAEKPFALLVGEDKPYTLNLRMKGAPCWMIILFNPKKIPEIVPAIDVNREKLETYFDLK
jgi:hypothetical protein